MKKTWILILILLPIWGYGQIGDSRSKIVGEKQECLQIMNEKSYTVFKCDNHRFGYWFNADGFCYSNCWEFDDSDEAQVIVVDVLIKNGFHFSKNDQTRMPIYDNEARADIFFDDNLFMAMIFKVDCFGNPGKRTVVLYYTELDK